MNEEILLKKLKSEYEYLKLEVEYQTSIFNKAKEEFDKKFLKELNLDNLSQKEQVSEKKETKNRTKKLDKVYKKLAQKVHPDKAGGDDADFQKLKESIDEYDIDTVLELASKYNVNVSAELDDLDFFENGIKKLKNKIEYYNDTFVMLWWNEKDKTARDIMEVKLLKKFGKKVK